eukprot:TRINITY_DN599_c0_g2_i2.p1 TRINITY_DN599_c0_g2~~TRINITY_DN599_c0_g2_i2.p1  ORF type:complete len:462 (+),score=63.28 TRINITY_DN599_c0_g2_i2:1109-2494(+)
MKAHADPSAPHGRIAALEVAQTLGYSSESYDETKTSKPRRGRAPKTGNGKSTAATSRNGGPLSPQPRKEFASAELGEDCEAVDDPNAYDWPPLVCCFGEAVNEFLPSVRVSRRQMDPHVYSTWKRLQWSPPEFARAPGGPACNTAVALSRLGGRVAFMGKFGRDPAGDALLLILNVNGVQTRGVRFMDTAVTGMSRLHLKHGNGGVRVELASPPAESMFLKSDIDLDILTEAQMFYFTSLSLTSIPLATTLVDALSMATSRGASIFFDLNLALPLWQSQEKTLDTIEGVWFMSNFIEMTTHELEFLLGEEEYKKRRKRQPMYYAKTPRELKKRRYEYHYEPNEIESLWHADMKCLFVTDGTYRIHYYTSAFHGSVAGTEDVLVTPFTCDRSGSGDALVAGIIRKLTAEPDILQDQSKLEKALRFAICAGIISQWTVGAFRGMPTESAAQNLTEQVYPPSMI